MINHSFYNSYVKLTDTSQLPVQTPSIQSQLEGEAAFYNQADYIQSTQKDLHSKALMPVTYSLKNPSLVLHVIRIAKFILSIIIFPVGVYKLLHLLVGKLVIPASNSCLLYMPVDKARAKVAELIKEGYDWKFKRITVEMDGAKLDAMIVGTASTLGNGRWLLASNGNGEAYEYKLIEATSFYNNLRSLNSNAIIFNYPGVGSSSGTTSRKALANSYRAMLHLLEDRKKGIGAKEIIGYGFSIGGAVQAEGLLGHTLKSEVKYTFIKDRTFSDLSTTAKELFVSKGAYRITSWFIGSLIHLLGWNMSCVQSSRQLQASEIILQTAQASSSDSPGASFREAIIIDDGIITSSASLAKALLENPINQAGPKSILGIPETHNQTLYQSHAQVMRIISASLHPKA